jgi:hypothetical protein
MRKPLYNSFSRQLRISLPLRDLCELSGKTFN